MASQVSYEAWLLGARIEQDNVKSLELFIAPGWISAARKQPELVVRVLESGPPPPSLIILRLMVQDKEAGQHRVGESTVQRDCLE
jgi:hypothetical protein